MTTVRRGYRFQFARRPPSFHGVLATTMHSEDAQVLRTEVMNLLEKDAIEIVPPAQSEFGFYSRYILVSKKDGGLRSLDLKDAYFHIQVAPHYRRFLRFAFEGVAYHTRSYRLGCPWLPRLLHDAWMRLSSL